MPREKNDPEFIPPTNPSEESQALSAPVEIMEIPAEKSAPPAATVNTPQTSTRPASANTKTIWRILVFLFKFVVFMAVLAALAGVVYFGWPIVYNQYVLPVQINTSQIAEMKNSQQENQNQLLALKNQLPELLTAQAQQAMALTALAPRMETLSGSINSQTTALAALEGTQISLQAGDENRQAELKQQVTLLKSMELLSRARLFLYQSNFGLAKQDVQAARDLLAGIQASPFQLTGNNLAEVVQRLDLTLSRLPDFPVAASDDLDIAWQILLQGQAQRTPTPSPLTPGETTPSPTPFTPAGTDTPSPAPIPVFTATP